MNGWRDADRVRLAFAGGRADFERAGDEFCYIAHWDAAMMPFALNEVTRFISPTKTLECLAAAKPVISTSIVDIVRCWGHLDAVRIAGSPADFIEKAAAALSLPERGSFVGSIQWIACWRNYRGTGPDRKWSN